jgi:hypothetical protein
MAPVILFMPVILNCVSLAASSETLGHQARLLPWQLIAEKVQQKNQFCSQQIANLPHAPRGPKNPICDLAPNKSYAYQLNQAINNIELPGGKVVTRSDGKISVSLAKYVGNSWQHIAEIDASIEANRIRLTEVFKEEGLHRLRFALEAEAGRSSNFETYAIVSDNWKRDLLRFCRRLKEQTESNPDSKLIFSSIAVSHLDHTMEMASKSSVLSRQMLTALADSVKSKEDFDSGTCPDLVMGLNRINLKRFRAAPQTRFVVFVPPCYDGSSKWPLLLNPDPKQREARNNYRNRSGLIDVWWHMPGFEKYEWKNWEYFLNILRSKLNLDEDRIYLYGLCGNGFAAISLALNHPDRWAECVSILGSSCRHLACNAFNLPLIYIQGTHSQRSSISFYNLSLRSLLYWGSKDLRHSKLQGPEKNVVEQLRGKPVPDRRREEHPQRVLYRIDTLGNPKAYWIQILGREDEHFVGTIDATVDGQTILVKTDNISGYRLDLVQAPTDSNRPVEVIENGRSLGSVTGDIFIKKPDAYADAASVKNDCLHGPIWDAFTDAYVVAYGCSGRDSEFMRASKDLADYLANGAPCFCDDALPGKFIESHNLILVGTPRTNHWLRKVVEELPIKVVGTNISANGKTYRGEDMGFFLIRPNPLNPARYVAVFYGTSARAMTRATQAYSQLQSMLVADAAIYEVSGDDEIKWHVTERFDTLWDWHSTWNEALGTVSKKHSEWRWKQWAARAIREQLDCDVVVYENPLRFRNFAASGQITCRDLHYNFKNDWMLKIQVNGNSLTRLLMEQFKRAATSGVEGLEIEGVDFGGQQHNGSDMVLGINEIENDRKYTLACPEGVIWGRGLGAFLQDYKVVGEGHFVPLLRDYLCKNKNSHLNAQLNSIEPKIY